jgi:hypothetical protein
MFGVIAYHNIGSALSYYTPRQTTTGEMPS